MYSRLRRGFGFGCFLRDMVDVEKQRGDFERPLFVTRCSFLPLTPCETQAQETTKNDGMLNRSDISQEELRIIGTIGSFDSISL